MSQEEILEQLRRQLQAVADEARAADPEPDDTPVIVEMRMETITLVDTARDILRRLPGGLGRIVLSNLPGDDPTGDWGTLVDHAVDAARQRNWPIARGSVQRIVQGLSNLHRW